MSYMHIDNLYKNQDILMFKECYAMEKIHGCVQAMTKINLYDGSKIPITQIKKGDYVLGKDKNGSIIPSKVLNIFDNGQEKNWLYIVGTRFMAGRGGNGKFAINCTEQHKFYSPLLNKYILAKNLKVNDEVYCLKSDKHLTFLQKQILLGKMLGDGSLFTNSISGKVEWAHKEVSKEYMKWLDKSLGYIMNPRVSKRISGYGTKMLLQQTINNFFIKDFLKTFIKNNRKIIPKWVQYELSPIALAIWYMDDRSLTYHTNQNDRISFATCNFTYEDCNILKKGLERLNIFATIKKYGKYHRIVVNANESIKLFLLISPYIVNCMQYKLPKKYRRTNHKLPIEDLEYSHELTIQKITSIKKKNQKIFTKYDLETETNNYFANDILVHNSSAHISWKSDVPLDDKMINEIIKDESMINRGKVNLFCGGCKAELFKSLFDTEELKNKFIATGLESVVIYGEGYGGKMQGMSHTYGKDLKFIAFEVKIDKYWLDVPNAHNFCKEIGIEFVFYRKISTKLEEIDKARDWISAQAVRNGIEVPKIQEGVVLRPLIELIKNNGARIICKHKRDEFMETSKPRKIEDLAKLKILEDAKAVAEEWITTMRLNHILDKIENVCMENMGEIIKAMIADVKREGEGEIAWSKSVEKYIGQTTAKLTKQYFQDKLKEGAN